MTVYRLSVAAACMASVLCACNAPQVKESIPVSSSSADSGYKALQENQQQHYAGVDDLNEWLPGFYSNYAQVIESGGAAVDVSDLTIRRLPTPQSQVYLFETQQRESILANYDLYFTNANSETGQAELHFARMTGSELSMSLPETLETGRQRVLPGCAISLAPFNRQSLTTVDRSLMGKSHTDTCRFEDPVNGEVAFERSLSISSQQIAISEVALKPGEVIEDLPLPVLYRKHQAYEATVSLNASVLAADTGSTGWQKSTTFNLYDDGRVNELYDTDMQQMDYAIRLARLNWRENEPPYLKMEIIHLKTGAVQAYSWFEGDSQQIDWQMDWVETHLTELETGLE